MAHFALAFANFFFAINLTAVKHLTNLSLAKPFGINVIRVAVTVILLWLLFLGKPIKEKIEKRDWPRLILCSVTGIAINQLLFLKGLSLTYPIHAALLMLITPILIIFLAAWLLKERIGVMKLIGLTLGIAGALVLITAKETSSNADNIVLGDVLIIINAISYTIYFVLVKPLMLRYNPVVILRWVFTLGLLLVIPFGWREFIEIPWQNYGPVDFTCMGLIVFTGTFFAYLFNLYGIKSLGASVAGFYIYTQPVFAALIAMVFLHEQITAYKILAAALIFAGVYLTNVQKKNA